MTEIERQKEPVRYSLLLKNEIFGSKFEVTACNTFPVICRGFSAGYKKLSGAWNE